MRIGILTFSNAFNLGAALQAYSLQKTLEEMGHDAELIDYRCPAIEAMHKMRPIFHRKIGMKPRVYNLIYNIVFIPRRIRFKAFQKKMKKSQVYSRETIKKTNGSYDLFISGSDQVFNLKLTDNDSTFFLDFVQEGKKASYAASLGTYLPEKQAEYQSYLKSFDNLSVREKSTEEIFRQELGISAEVMPDPVFLHTKEEWKKLLGIKERKRRTYVLVYSLIEVRELYEVAEKVAKEQGLKIVVITKALRPFGKADRVVRNAGPKEFVELIENADYVVTNSFHGTAFSLIFEKQFIVLLPSSSPDRIVDLLKQVGLSDRAVDNVNGFYSGNINFRKIQSWLSEYQKWGRSYLRNLF